MKSEAAKRYELLTTLRIMAIGIAAALIYALVSDGISRPMPVINAIMIGAIIGWFVGIFEFRIINQNFRRKQKFIPLMLIRIISYSYVILSTLFLVFSWSRVFWYDMSYIEVLTSDEFQHFLFQEDFVIASTYTIGLTFFLTFTMQVSRKLGQGYLLNIITGTYFRPHVKDRVFLFVTLQNIREVISVTGLNNSFVFVNDFLYDMSPEILTHRARIHHYVDNQLVLYWPFGRAVDHARCIECFQALVRGIERRHDYYTKQYGISPRISGGIHGGRVVQGEIGIEKTEIAFYGDVLNTTARIAARAESKYQLLVSETVMAEIPDMLNYQVMKSDIGVLRGKSTALQVYDVIMHNE